MASLAGKVAGILALVAYIPYILAVLQKQARPNRATWFIWAIMDVLVAVSSFYTGARNTLWVPVSFTIGASVIAILSLKYGARAWTMLETFCSIFAGISIALWIISNSPLPTLLLSIAVMLFGAIPTIRKIYRDPSEENRLSWGMFFLSCTVNLLAVEKWEFVIWIFPVSVFLFDGIIAALLFLPRKKSSVPA